MHKLIRTSVSHILESLIKSLQSEGLISDLELPFVRVDTTKNPKFGDVSSNIALLLSRPMAKPAPEIAKLILKAYEESAFAKEDQIAQMSIAGPGFINIFLGEKVWHEIISEIICENERYGIQETKRGKILLEFVSANPTGPLTLAHGRQAAVGDVLAKLLVAVGYDVHLEFYLNDAGRQIELLGRSVWIRYLELFGVEEPLPEDAYQGEYIRDIAKLFKDEYGDRYVKDGSLPVIQKFSNQAAGIILKSIKEDLENFGVHFDRFFSETEFRKTPEVDQCLKQLEKNIYKKEGALWFRSSDFGDDKDRVLVKSSEEQTYFCPDIAYHENKYNRGFDRLIDMWGPDHHGYIARMRAALRALGHDEKAFQIIILQLATLYEGEKKLSMSTRKGEFVTLRQIMKEVGVDVARYFFCMRRTDTHLDFDLALAKKQSVDNPVYYVQYAHARISSIIREAEKGGHDYSQEAFSELSIFDEKEEITLIKVLSQYPDILESAAGLLQPNILTDYLQKLASSFHSFYGKCKVLTEQNHITRKRLALVSAVQIVIRNGLKLLGIKAPHSM